MTTEKLISAPETLLQELQKSLEVGKVLQTFASFISRSLPVDSLSFYHNEKLLNVVGQPCFEARRVLRSPLYIEQNYLGELRYCFTDPLSHHQEHWLRQCEQMFVYPLRNSLTHRNVCHQAVRDHLTNLGNRVLLEEVLGQLLCVHERTDLQHAIMLLDLDNFKQVNDNHGHRRGDSVLATFATLLREQLRGCDQLFRYGGDEFLIIIANPKDSVLQQIFRRLQRAVNDNPLLSSHAITCSAGAVMIKPAHTAESLMQEVDQALYKAKNSGKDQLESSGPVPLFQHG